MRAENRFRIDGQVAIVTGAAAGIGRAISNLFAAAGAAVVLVGRPSCGRLLPVQYERGGESEPPQGRVRRRGRHQVVGRDER
mgnify:CR=1 FL=1